MNTVAIIGGGLASALFTKALDRNTQPGANLSAPAGPNPSTVQTLWTPAHVKPGAVLLTDDAIAAQNYSSGMSASDRRRFLTECLPLLSIERIDYPALLSQCGGLSYQGGNASLSTVQDGKIALSIGAPAYALAGGGSSGGIGSAGIAAAGTAASTAVTVATFGVGVAIAILGIIAAHHAAAVKREQQLECTLIPPANHALAVIEDAVINRRITPQQGQQALAQLHTDFISKASGGPGGLQESGGKCNAMCWYAHFLQAICMKKQNRYAQLI